MEIVERLVDIAGFVKYRDNGTNYFQRQKLTENYRNHINMFNNMIIND